MTITDTQLDALRNSLAAALTAIAPQDPAPVSPAAAPDAPGAPVSTSSEPAAPATAPTAPVASSSPVGVKSIVAQNLTEGWRHNPATRYGVVLGIDAPVVTGTDNTDPNNPVPIMTVHADVVWFGGDGRSTVPVGELNAIG